MSRTIGDLLTEQVGAMFGDSGVWSSFGVKRFHWLLIGK